MKVAVFSDTHSNTALIVEAVACCHPDVVIHLGDHDRDADILRLRFPDIAVYAVRGNCDIASTAPLTDIVPLGPVKAYITHGHSYPVKYGRYEPVAYAAQEAGAKIAMFGHTHSALNVEWGGVKILNPGTAGQGRTLTWALVEVFDNGGIATEIRAL